jgi:hypothetical protein
MTDIRDDATGWRQLCQTAYFEFDPLMLLQRVGEARSAVLDRIGDNLSKPSSDEQHELHNALETLSTLEELAERDISELKKTVHARLAGTVRSMKREVI